jgi:hypothetical protein
MHSFFGPGGFVNPLGVGVGGFEFGTSLVGQQIEQLATIFSIPGHGAIFFDAFRCVESLCHDSCGVEISREILWVSGDCQFFFVLRTGSLHLLEVCFSI